MCGQVCAFTLTLSNESQVCVVIGRCRDYSATFVSQCTQLNIFLNGFELCIKFIYLFLEELSVFNSIVIEHRIQEDVNAAKSMFKIFSREKLLFRGSLESWTNLL